MAYEMRISDWSSDVCSSDLADRAAGLHLVMGCRFGLDHDQRSGEMDGDVERRDALHQGEREDALHRVGAAQQGDAVAQGMDRLRAEDAADRQEIGRESCRARVCQNVSISGVVVSLIKKPHSQSTTSHNKEQ